jgi:hypothetical protein
MTTLHAGLELYRDQLHHAIERDLGRRSPLRRARQGRRLRVVVPSAVAAATAATLVVAFTSGPPVQSADAAILHHVAAALTPPAGALIHEQAMVSLAGQPAQPFELWQQTTAPYKYRVIKWGHEGTGTARHGTPNDPAATLRSFVQSGLAKVDARTTFDGVAAYKLSVHGAGDTFLNGTVYVSQGDYHPLEIDTAAGGGEVIKYHTYEYLPGTSANLSLLGLPVQHK